MYRLVAAKEAKNVITTPLATTTDIKNATFTANEAATNAFKGTGEVFLTNGNLEVKKFENIAIIDNIFTESKGG